jgi:hypothetical protein
MLHTFCIAGNNASNFVVVFASFYLYTVCVQHAVLIFPIAAFNVSMLKCEESDKGPIHGKLPCYQSVNQRRLETAATTTS